MRKFAGVAALGFAAATGLVPTEATSGTVNLFANGGFDSGHLAPWVVLNGTTAFLNCNGTPQVVPAPFPDPITGGFRGSSTLQVGLTAGGTVGSLPNVNCVTVATAAQLDPTKAYVMYFQGTVMQANVADLGDLSFRNFNDAFNGSRGHAFAAMLLPGWCQTPASPFYGACIPAPGGTQFAFAVVGNGQDAGYLDNVYLSEFSTQDFAQALRTGRVVFDWGNDDGIGVPLADFTVIGNLAALAEPPGMMAAALAAMVLMRRFARGRA